MREKRQKKVGERRGEQTKENKGEKTLLALSQVHGERREKSSKERGKGKKEPIDASSLNKKLCLSFLARSVFVEFIEYRALSKCEEEREHKWRENFLVLLFQRMTAAKKRGFFFR